MTRRWIILGWLVAGVAARAEVIDRIAVTVGNQVITESDLLREIRVMAFLNHAQPDFSEAGKRKTAARMVDQRLVRRELELSRYPVPDAAEVTPVLKKFIEENYPAKGEYAEALAKAGITEAEVREQILWQLTLLRFIDVRFRPGVQVSDEEVREAFDKVAKSAPASISFDDVRDKLESRLIEEKVDRDLETWLTEARKRTGVEYREEVFGGRGAGAAQ